MSALFPQAPRQVLTAVQYGWLALGVCVLTIYGSLIPFRWQPRSWLEARAIFRKIALIDPSDLGARGDWVVSVVLFTALSYLLMAALCVDRRWQVGPVVGVLVAAFCAGLSVAIEFAQIYFPPRTVSLNDIAVESIGGVTGTVLWLAGGQRITQWARRLETSTSVAGLAKRLLPGYLALLLIVLLMPFDFTVSSAELAVKYREGKVWLMPFASVRVMGKMDVLANVAGFFPVGLLWTLAAERRQWQARSWREVLRFGLLVTSAVELLQLLVYSRLFDTTDLLTGTFAIWLGWQAALRWRTSQARAPVTFSPPAAPRWLTRPVIVGLVAVWLGAVFYFNWKPFDFTTNPRRFTGDEDLPLHGLRRMALLPLVDYYWGSKYELLDQFVRKTVSFLPLGMLMACALPRVFAARAAWRVVAAALLIAAVVETGRYYLPSRAPSVTDLLIQCFGAWLGFLLTRHLRVILWADRTWQN